MFSLLVAATIATNNNLIYFPNLKFTDIFLIYSPAFGPSITSW